MLIEQIVCRKNPEYIARADILTNRSPLATLALSNKSSKTDRDPTLLSGKLAKYFNIFLL
jgi:hypothetical protein